VRKTGGFLTNLQKIHFQAYEPSVVSLPLAWSSRLSKATPAQRNNFEIIGDGYGVHWLDVDEDLSAEGMLHGVPAPASGEANLGNASLVQLLSAI